MNILIMVLSNSNPPYDKLMEAQKKTWDSIEVEGVETIYYIADEFLMMHVPFKKALQENINRDFDFIFRTNSSSYVDKARLKDFLSGQPKVNTWIGNKECQSSGAGFVISKDIAEVLIDLLPDGLAGNPNDPTHEDQWIQQVLSEKGYEIKAGDRVEYNFDTNKIRKSYHYRCKSPNADRTNDVKAFNKIFNNQCFNE